MSANDPWAVNSWFKQQLTKKLKIKLTIICIMLHCLCWNILNYMHHNKCDCPRRLWGICGSQRDLQKKKKKVEMMNTAYSPSSYWESTFWPPVSYLGLSCWGITDSVLLIGYLNSKIARHSHSPILSFLYFFPGTKGLGKHFPLQHVSDLSPKCGPNAGWKRISRHKAECKEDRIY